MSLTWWLISVLRGFVDWRIRQTTYARDRWLLARRRFT